MRVGEAAVGPLRARDDGCELRLWVVAGASANEIAGLHGDRIKVRVSVPAEAGKANDAVCDLISEAIGSAVHIVSGHSARAKTLFAPGAAVEDVRGNLAL